MPYAAIVPISKGGIMRILMVEEDPAVIRRFLAAFREHMPYASIDIVSSRREFWDTQLQEYDAYIIANLLSGESTRPLVSKIRQKSVFPAILHNGRELFDPEAVQRNPAFARDSGGRAVLCRGDPMPAIEFLKAMVVEEGGKARLRKPRIRIVPAKIRFAPGWEGGRAITCGSQFGVAMRSMVAKPGAGRNAFAAREPSPACQSARAPVKPRASPGCCRP